MSDTRNDRGWRVQFSLIRLVCAVALFGVASIAWKSVLFFHGGRTAFELVRSFVLAWCASGAAIGTLLGRGIVGALVGLAVAVAWIAIAVTLFLTGVWGGG
jgi:hypothetical protein